MVAGVRAYFDQALRHCLLYSHEVQQADEALRSGGGGSSGAAPAANGQAEGGWPAGWQGGWPAEEDLLACLLAALLHSRGVGCPDATLASTCLPLFLACRGRPGGGRRQRWRRQGAQRAVRRGAPGPPVCQAARAGARGIHDAAGERAACWCAGVSMAAWLLAGVAWHCTCRRPHCIEAAGMHIAPVVHLSTAHRTWCGWSSSCTT